MPTNNLKALFKESFDRGDKWGSSLTAWFTVANEISYRDECTPNAWQYSPAMADDPRESDDYLYEECTQADLADLIQFGDVLERYTRNLERNGYSY